MVLNISFWAAKQIGSDASGDSEAARFYFLAQVMDGLKALVGYGARSRALGPSVCPRGSRGWIFQEEEKGDVVDVSKGMQAGSGEKWRTGTLKQHLE